MTPKPIHASTIRPASPHDLSAILILNTNIMENVNQSLDSDLVPNFAQTTAGKDYFTEALNRKDGYFLVAQENGELIGYVNGSAKDTPYRLSKYFEIENLGVLPQYRGQQIGTRLIETITKWAKENGYQKIYVNSYFHNTQAVNFYKKHGYSEIDISLEKSI